MYRKTTQGTRRRTLIQHVTGDMGTLKRELQSSLGKKDEEISVNPATGKISVKVRDFVVVVLSFGFHAVVRRSKAKHQHVFG